jgi:hypothetical protein
VGWLLLGVAFATGACDGAGRDLEACLATFASGLRPLAVDRAQRFLGKVAEDTARCRGGERAVVGRASPWVDWANYWATGDASSLAPSRGGAEHLGANERGIDGALLDLEYQRAELLTFNLLDNNGTYPDYVRGRDGIAGPALDIWPAMRLTGKDPQYAAVVGAGPPRCAGPLVRFRTLTGICNDVRNPLMGSTGQLFARNVDFDATFPDLGLNELARNRHGGRLGLLTPDPQVISRRLFTRRQSAPARCGQGRGLAGNAVEAECDYRKAPFLNVLAAFWIQFMTHDWFSHLEEGHNAPATTAVGCGPPLSAERIAELGCRPGDRIDRALIAEGGEPPTFTADGRRYLARAYRTTRNTVTAWWDASQIYGYDATSRRRVKRDPADPARLRMVAVDGQANRDLGHLPVLEASDPMNPQWAGQEATAFPDNWSLGLGLFHNVFAREHNLFVAAFRRQAAATPDDDSGLRDPAWPGRVIRYRDVGPDELFEIARLVVSAEIAKIHTLEWTPQLLYDEPLFLALRSNWSGLLQGHELFREALDRLVPKDRGPSADPRRAIQRDSFLASLSGIVGRDDAEHFGSPFNFPEEFVTVYRLHTMVPDLIEYREWNHDPDVVRRKIPVIDTLRGRATEAMRRGGLASWILSMGRQRAGLLTLQNHPLFLQNLALPRLRSATGRIDVAALDLIRDRERGVPRFNEFRRQYGLRTLSGFDDFVDRRLPADAPARVEQERLAGVLREIYGQHRCEAAKVITAAQVNADGTPITDCLGRPDGSVVDNVEDVDTVVGWLAEPTRPHGFAISETQLQVFILNASRRLFSDRFFTSSFRPAFYGHLGIRWVTDNGPDGTMLEPGRPNGHEAEVSPLKRVLLRTVPELAEALRPVVNVFDPWARDRGEYYALGWKARPGAEADAAFGPTPR